MRFLINSYIIFILLIAGGGKVMPQGNSEQKRFITSTASFFIPSSEIPGLELAAMKGNGEAAFNLALHYDLALNDEYNGEYWELIGAENGNIISAHNIAVALSYRNNYDIRGIYWFRVAAKHGVDSSIKNLNLLGISINFDIPDDSIFEQMPDYLTIEEIKECEEGALKGSGIAALVLANFYCKVERDNNKLEYWYRIGAQNGNKECQVFFGKILMAKNDMLSQERGKFWLNRSHRVN